jgi:hypothetical protein
VDDSPRSPEQSTLSKLLFVFLQVQSGLLLFTAAVTLWGWVLYIRGAPGPAQPGAGESLSFVLSQPVPRIAVGMLLVLGVAAAVLARQSAADGGGCRSALSDSRLCLLPQRSTGSWSTLR